MSEAQLRVMGYNINFGLVWSTEDFNKPHAQSVFLAIEQCDCDVICLTETTPMWEAFISPPLRKRYPFQIWWDSSENWYAGGQAILSKYPITSCTQLQPTSGWFFSGLFRVQVPNIGTVQILNAHLRPSLSSGSWWQHIGAFFQAPNERMNDILAWCGHIDRGEPYIIVGDFNESHSGIFSGKACNWLESNFGMINAIKQHAPDIHTWEWPVYSYKLTAHIDHLFYSKEHFDCPYATVLEQGASDHRPILATFLLKQ
jgi:endonuclease/exonuclease/phosphatase family metal-dependent hydrolase